MNGAGTFTLNVLNNGTGLGTYNIPGAPNSLIESGGVRNVVKKVVRARWRSARPPPTPARPRSTRVRSIANTNNVLSARRLDDGQRRERRHAQPQQARAKRFPVAMTYKATPPRTTRITIGNVTALECQCDDRQLAGGGRLSLEFDCQYRYEPGCQRRRRPGGRQYDRQHARGRTEHGPRPARQCKQCEPRPHKPRGRIYLFRHNRPASCGHR
jgi:hypothetical protein